MTIGEEGADAGSKEVGVYVNPGLNRFLSSLESPRPEDKAIYDLLPSERPKTSEARDAIERGANGALQADLPAVVQVLEEYLSETVDRTKSFYKRHTSSLNVEAKVRSKQDALKVLRFEPLEEGGQFGEREARLALSLVHYIVTQERVDSSTTREWNIKMVGYGDIAEPATEEDARRQREASAFGDKVSSVKKALESKYSFAIPKEGYEFWSRQVDPDYYKKLEEEREKEILGMS